MQKRAEQLKQCRDAWSGLMEVTVRVRPSRYRATGSCKCARAPVRNGQMMDGRETGWMGVRCGAGKRGTAGEGSEWEANAAGRLPRRRQALGRGHHAEGLSCRCSGQTLSAHARTQVGEVLSRHAGRTGVADSAQAVCDGGGCVAGGRRLRAGRGCGRPTCPSSSRRRLSGARRQPASPKSHTHTHTSFPLPATPLFPARPRRIHRPETVRFAPRFEFGLAFSKRRSR